LSSLDGENLGRPPLTWVVQWRAKEFVKSQDWSQDRDRIARSATLGTKAMTISNPSPSLYNEDLAPAEERK